MSKGPKPKPTADKRLRGNPGKRKLNADEPVFETGIPEPPGNLEGLALMEWNRITQELAAKQIITHVDMAILGLYCTTYADWCNEREEIKKEQRFLKTDKGYQYVNPRIGLINTYGRDLARYAAELGITPSSRTKVRAIKKPEGDDPSKRLASKLFGSKVTITK